MVGRTTPEFANDAKRFPFSRRGEVGLERWKRNSIRGMAAVPFVYDIGAGNRPFHRIVEADTSKGCSWILFN